MKVFVLVLLGLAWPIAAQSAPVKVVSGEHGDFTRLVLELPEPGEWRLGRTTDGYEFALIGSASQRYDLSTVWNRIPKARLSAVWSDPETGNLHFRLACDCYSFPFEFRPGMVVIDFKNGSAPAGSVFELTLDGTPIAPVAAETAKPSAAGKEPMVAGYDWLRNRSGATESGATEAKVVPPLSLPTGDGSLDPLRDALLTQISRGISQGVIDLAEPGAKVTQPGQARTDGPWSRVSVGELPGLAAGNMRTAAGNMLPDGAACIPDASLDIASWAPTGPASEYLADLRSDLFGEFDIPDPGAIEKAVRGHLSLGFGAEALQYIDLVRDKAEAPDLSRLAALAHLLDEGRDPEGVFQGMASCETYAAFWAVLSMAALPPEKAMNTKAVLRGFTALPPALRQYLGPDLAIKFQSVSDTASAQLIRASVARNSGVAQRDLDLLDAQMQLSSGDIDAARSSAQDALSGAGPDTVEAIIALVEASFHDSTPITIEQLDSVRAYVHEVRGTTNAAALNRANVLALALAGQPEEAVAALPSSPETQADLWKTIAALAEDTAFLNLAVIGPAALPPAVESAVAETIAKRLLALGFPDAALLWLGPVSAQSPEDLRLMAASAELARGDARRARDLAEGLPGQDADRLRADILTRLGATEPAVNAWVAAGEADQADRLRIWSGDWSGLSSSGPATWKDAATLVVKASASTDEGGGLLAQSASLVDESVAARQVIAGLLATVPDPAKTP